MMFPVVFAVRTFAMTTLPFIDAPAESVRTLALIEPDALRALTLREAPESPLMELALIALALSVPTVTVLNLGLCWKAFATFQFPDPCDTTSIMSPETMERSPEVAVGVWMAVEFLSSGEPEN